jgi:hypothetical protein
MILFIPKSWLILVEIFEFEYELIFEIQISIPTRNIENKQPDNTS